MAKLALYAHLKAKPEKKAEVEAFLKSALPLAQNEKGTITWYAFQEDEGSYGIFDTFETEEARQAHLDGPIAKALMAKAGELLSQRPIIHVVRYRHPEIPRRQDHRRLERIRRRRNDAATASAASDDENESVTQNDE